MYWAFINFWYSPDLSLSISYAHLSYCFMSLFRSWKSFIWSDSLSSSKGVSNYTISPKLNEHNWKPKFICLRTKMNHKFHNTINILFIAIELDFNYLSSLFKGINILCFFLDVEIIVVLLIVIEYLDFLIISSFVVEVEDYFLTRTVEIKRGFFVSYLEIVISG